MCNLSRKLEATCAFECEFPEKVTVDDVLTHLKTTCPHVQHAEKMELQGRQDLAPASWGNYLEKAQESEEIKELLRGCIKTLVTSEEIHRFAETVLNWHKATDGRGLDKETMKYNKAMMSYLLEDSLVKEDYAMMDVNRKIYHEYAKRPDQDLPYWYHTGINERFWSPESSELQAAGMEKSTPDTKSVNALQTKGRGQRNQICCIQKPLLSRNRSGAVSG
ncbi:Hypp6556 [Branchiostoma lanceolatum]|uniref:Hypp6556 protein n=1 Tax=Branchiostoma lanceolatum TaxID=7740 RepID=A0A8J9YV56_BRALA|nr:Hypp6556 [Branchiostoma lanceolatum]